MRRNRRPLPERLESRTLPSGSLPPNTIGSSSARVTAPRGIAQAEVVVAPANLTPRKHATMLGVFVQPAQGSTLSPRIVAVEQAGGHKLPVKEGRPFVPGRGGEQAAAFVKVSQPGPLLVLVTGQDHSTGSLVCYVTLAGDVNGDGAVNLTDLELFAPTYFSHVGQPQYNVAADFNQNGIVNLYDAKALEHNIAPLGSEHALSAVINLSPADQARFPTSRNSGGSTFKQNVTIVGHTTPGSIVIQDTSAQDYRFQGAAVPTDAQGFFFVPSRNKDGINNNDLLILDPFGHQLIRSFPVFWIPFAAPGSRLR
jgi:hypothetical protein